MRSPSSVEMFLAGVGILITITDYLMQLEVRYKTRVLCAYWVATDSRVPLSTLTRITCAELWRWWMCANTREKAKLDVCEGIMTRLIQSTFFLAALL